MPDHPHEGECKPEMEFSVINPKTGLAQTIRTQNIATSFVLAGNEASGKTPTIPHCFPSIGVFDGRPANVGRIVVDSTWHHFVNINLNGLNPATYAIIEHYYKNIARWMTRKKTMFCFYRRLVVYAVFDERILESAMLNPKIKLEDVPVAELLSIGSHAIEIVAENFSPAQARLFALDLLEPLMPKLAFELNPWRPDRVSNADDPVTQWVNPDGLLAMAIGNGVVKLRDELGEINEPISGEQEALISKVFEKGMELGLKKAIRGLERELPKWSKLEKQIEKNDYLVQGTLTDAKGKAVKGLRIRAVDQDWTAENRLGEDTTTDAKGRYRIPYKQTDFVINGKESGGADIIVYVYNEEGKLIQKSAVYRNSPQETTIDIQLD